MKLSDIILTAHIVQVDDQTHDWLSSSDEDEDEDGPSVHLATGEHEDGYTFDDVEVDLATQHWVELTDRDGEEHTLEFFMLRPMTAADLENRDG